MANTLHTAMTKEAEKKNFSASKKQWKSGEAWIDAQKTIVNKFEGIPTEVEDSISEMSSDKNSVGKVRPSRTKWSKVKPKVVTPTASVFEHGRELGSGSSDVLSYKERIMLHHFNSWGWLTNCMKFTWVDFTRARSAFNGIVVYRTSVSLAR